MRRFAIILTGALALGSLASAAGFADDVQSQIQTAYAGECSTAIAKDSAGFSKFFDPKFTGTNVDGQQQTLAQTVSQVAAPPAGLTIATCAFTITNYAAANGVATILASQTATGTYAPAGGTPVPFTLLQESTDTWSIAGPPLQTSSVETGTRLTMGGKVVQEKGKLTTPPSRR
jgi:hypothetical protein